MSKRRRQQQHHARVAVEQELFRLLERPCSSRGVAPAGDGSPGLGNRVDPALRGSMGPNRGTVVEVCSAVPGAIPTVRLDGTSHLLRLPQPMLGALRLSAVGCDGREVSQRLAQEPAEPYAFTRALVANSAHTVVP